MKRDPEKLKIYGGSYGFYGHYGEDGGYFCKDYGQTIDGTVVDSDRPPAGQPSLWCHWKVTEDGLYLQWDGGEKFYCYVEWLQYLINHFFDLMPVVLNGKIEWQGEEMSDSGVITVKNSIVTTKILK